MTIIKNPYKTVIGKAMNIKASLEAVENVELATKMLTENYSNLMNGAGNNDSVAGGIVLHNSPEQVQVRPFQFVITTLDPAGLARNTGKQLVVGDARPFTAVTRTDGQTRVANVMEFVVLQAIIAAQMKWADGDYQTIAALSPVMQRVYCRWIGGIIKRRLRLDEHASIRVRALAAYYFQCQFVEGDEINETQARAMTAAALRHSGCDNSFEQTLMDVGMIADLHDFVATLKKSIPDALQLDSLDTGILLEQLAGTWFGFGGRQLAMCAADHPPTFAALLYASMAQNGYRKAGLAEIADQFKGNKGGSEYIRNFSMLLGLN